MFFYYKNLNLSYGRAINEGISVGATLKWVYGSLAEYEASTYGLDLGALYKTPIPGITFGFTAKNLLGRMGFIEEEDPLPLKIVFGLGYRPSKDILLGLDLIKMDTIDGIRLGFGTEVNLAKILSLRGGFQQKGDPGFSGITLGLGIEIFGLKLDYAWVPYGELGDTHRYSVLFKIDTSPPSQPLVKDDGDYTNKTTLNFSWLSDDKESGIDRYRYYLSSSRDLPDLVPWKETMRSKLTLSGLPLEDGKTYYLFVMAKNRSGLFSSWSKVGVSDGITFDGSHPLPRS